MRKIKAKDIRAPKSTRNVTIDGFVQFQKAKAKVDEIEIKLQSAPYEDKHHYKFEFYETIVKAMAAVSSYSHSQLMSIKDPFDKDMNAIGHFARIITEFNDFFSTLRYRPQEPVLNNFQFRSKKFRSQKFHLFEFGQVTVLQYHYFSIEWQAFFEATNEELKKFNFEHLPKMIALIAWPKNEINETLGTVTVKEDAYKKLNEKIAERTEAFKQLPIETAFKIVDHFFFNSPKYRKITQTFSKAKAPKRPTLSESITQFMD